MHCSRRWKQVGFMSFRFTAESWPRYGCWGQPWASSGPNCLYLGPGEMKNTAGMSMVLGQELPGAPSLMSRWSPGPSEQSHMWMLPTLSSQGRSRGSVLCSQHPFLWHPLVPFGLGTSLLVRFEPSPGCPHSPEPTPSTGQLLPSWQSQSPASPGGEQPTGLRAGRRGACPSR